VKDWAGIAKAYGVEIHEPDLDRISKTLTALEATFRPLAENLDSSLEPAAVFLPEEDGDEHR
jgi:hypothetical protein